MDGGTIGVAISAWLAIIIARGARFLSMASWADTFVWATLTALISGGIYFAVVRPQSTAQTTDQVQTSPALSLPTATELLDQRLVASGGESCESQGIKLVIEDQYLVAYPQQGGSPIRYQIDGPVERTLRLRLGGRVVIFDIQDDGFIHIDRGQERWVRFCD